MTNQRDELLRQAREYADHLANTNQLQAYEIVDKLIALLPRIEQLTSFDQWYNLMAGALQTDGNPKMARAAYIAGLRRAAEIATDENCDQTEYRCLTIERIAEAIEREASKLERE